MDSLVKILQYIFIRNYRRPKFDSVESFFEKGKYFPALLSIIYKIDEIPGIRNNIEEDDDAEANNKLALQFLFKKNKEIGDLKPGLNDQFNLLKLILTKEYFKISKQQIFEKCNKRLEQKGIKFETEEEFINVKNLITILRVVTNKENSTDNDGKFKNNDDLLYSTFENARIPLILDSETPLDDQNQFIFYIQVKIIFDEVAKISKNESNQNIQLTENSKDKKSSKFFFNIFFKRKQKDPDYSSDTEYDEKDNENNDEKDDDKKDENLQALLDTINAIGKRFDIKFENFEMAVKNDAIPKYVMKFFNCKSIKNVNIQKEEKETNSYVIYGRLSENQIKNIEAVIEFIKTKKEKFKILLFDFRDIRNVEASTISFYTNFLNCFFLRTPKQIMYSRIVKLLCSHTSKFDEKYNDLLFTKYKIYPSLLHFIVKGDLHFPFNYHRYKFTDEDAKPYFTNANVPMIINKKLLWHSKKYVLFPVFYQLQFIFDALEKSSLSCFVVETLMNSFFQFKSIKVPKYNEIAVSIRVKQKSIKIREKMTEKYRDKIELEKKNYAKKERKEIAKPKTFNDICEEQKDLLTKMKDKISSNKDEEETKIEPKSYDEFWNSPDPEYINEKGIIYNKKESNKEKSSQDWTNEFAEIVRKSNEEIKKKEEKEKKERKSADNKGNSRAKSTIITSNEKSGREARLCKIFTYDEQNQKWIYNPEVFEFFAVERKINVSDSITPLILLFNSDKDDLITISSKLISTLYPSPVSNELEDDIFVYPLCDRSLTMLNFYIDFYNSEKASIKPIFLLLHVPKRLENHPKIRLIVTQIYSFLSTVCDLEITVLNRNHYLDQIKFVKNILNINEYFELNSSKLSIVKEQSKSTERNDEEPPFSFVYQSPSLPIDSTNSSNKNSNENSNENLNENSNKNPSNQFIYKKPRFIFLANDSTVKFSNELSSEFNKSKFFKNIVSKINKEKYLYFININDTETYESFLDCMNDSIMNNTCCTFGEIQSNFKFIEKCYFSDFYLQIASKDYYYYDLEKLIIQRLKMIKINESSNKESNEDEDKKSGDDKQSDDEYTILKKEIFKAIPNENTYFINDCIANTKLLDHKDFCNETIRNTLRENLQICADSHLLCIEQSLNQKYFWNYQQMASMIKSHKIFIKNEFFNIVKNLFEENLIETIFTLNFDIVEKQLKKDKIRIMDAMQPFIDKINIKNCTAAQDLRGTMVEGTNYAMRETENLRETRVEVEIDQKLTDVIKQDF